MQAVNGLEFTGESFNVATVSGTGNTLTTASDDGDYKVAKFINNGNFTITSVGDAPNNVVEYIVVAGGGGGAGGHGGAGGAGGMLVNTSYTVTAQAYAVVIGGGGAAGGGSDGGPGPGYTAVGGDGSDSTTYPCCVRVQSLPQTAVVGWCLLHKHNEQHQYSVRKRKRWRFGWRRSWTEVFGIRGIRR